MGGVLEKFLILFESDAEKSSKDVKKFNDSLDDTEKKGKKAAQASGSAGEQFLALGKKALGAYVGITSIRTAFRALTDTANRIDALVKFSKSIGENVENVDAWGGAVVRAGGTAADFQSSIKSLNEKMVDASIKGYNEIIPFFNQLGISILDSQGKVKSTLQVLPELAKRFENLDAKQSLALGQKLGLDKGTIMLLQKGTGEIDKLIERQKRLGLVNEEAGRISANFNIAMSDFKRVTASIAQNLLITFVPAITWVLEKFINLSVWAKENKPIIYGFFIGLAVAALPSLISIAVAGWAAVAPIIAMAAPFIALAAVVGVVASAIALLVEDIWAFINGEKSLIGEILNKWPIVGKVVNAIKEGITSFFGTMKDFGSFLIDIFMAPEKALDSLKSVLESVIESFDISGIIEEWPILGEIINTVADKVKWFAEIVKNVTGFIFDLFFKPLEALKTIEKGIQRFAKFLGFGSKEPEKLVSEEEINRNIKRGQEMIIQTTQTPLASQTSNSINNRSISRNTSVQIGDVNVHTQATDAKGIASGIGSSIHEEMRTTVDNFSDGIAI